MAAVAARGDRHLTTLAAEVPVTGQGLKLVHLPRGRQRPRGQHLLVKAWVKSGGCRNSCLSRWNIDGLGSARSCLSSHSAKQTSRFHQGRVFITRSHGVIATTFFILEEKPDKKLGQR